MDRDDFKFPCTNTNDGELTTLSLCAECENHITCDIYSTMLDEANDMD